MNTTTATTSPASGRVPPHSVEAEGQILSACLLDGPDVLGRCLNSGITPTSFYVQAHSLIFDRLQSMLAEGKSIDLAVLAEELKRTRHLDEVGGYAYLTQISRLAPTTAMATYFIEKLTELAALRDTIRAATAIVEGCYSYTGTTVESELGPAAARLMSIIAGQGEKTEAAWGDVVKNAEENARTLCSKDSTPRRTVSLGWQALDVEFEPMRPGQLVVIGARPSVGKSSLLRPIAYGAARAGQHVLFVSLEVKPASIAMQFAATSSRVGVRRLPTAHPLDQKDFRDAVASLRGLPITVSDSRRSLAAICAKARAMHSRRPLDLLVIDYLGLIEDCDRPAKGETKASAIGRVTKGLKRIAMELDCVVMVAAQLNRLSVTEANRQPRLSDLRDSGDVEQDADKVIFIHRPDTDPDACDSAQPDTASPADVPTFFVNLIQAKGRDDGTGIKSMRFVRETASFAPRSTTHHHHHRHTSTTGRN